MSGVSFDVSNYLSTHPDVNAYFTSLKGQPRDQIRDQVQSYLDANPQVGDELQAIRQPRIDFQNRCGVRDPLTVSAALHCSNNRGAPCQMYLIRGGTV